MIQIDINKPTNCDDCPFCVDYDCIIHERVTHEYYDSSQEQYGHCPLVEPERKKGEWIKNSTHINCSVCKHCSWSLSFEDTVRQFNFCPNCGAEMRGEADDETGSD